MSCARSPQYTVFTGLRMLISFEILFVENIAAGRCVSLSLPQSDKTSVGFDVAFGFCQMTGPFIHVFAIAAANVVVIGRRWSAPINE